MIRTRLHRAYTVVTDPKDQEGAKEHVKTALRHCGYENWSFKRACTKKPTQIAANKDSTKTTRCSKNLRCCTVRAGGLRKIETCVQQLRHLHMFQTHQT